MQPNCNFSFPAKTLELPVPTDKKGMMMMTKILTRRNIALLIQMIVVSGLLVAIDKGAPLIGINLDSWLVAVMFIPVFFGIGALGTKINYKISHPKS
jgi:hypothetical protein